MLQFQGTSRSDHGRLARWRKWRAFDVGEAKEVLEIELWHRWINGRVAEWAVTWVKRRKRWRMSWHVAHSPTFPSLHLRVSSVSNPSVVSPTLQLILQHFRRFTYVTAHSATLSLLHLRHSSFSNTSFASPTSQALHLRHLTSRPWFWCRLGCNGRDLMYFDKIL